LGENDIEEVGKSKIKTGSFRGTESLFNRIFPLSFEGEGD
jgi:hypothetical protein